MRITDGMRVFDSPAEHASFYRRGRSRKCDPADSCPVWIQRDDTPIRLYDMGDRHLLSAARMLWRQWGRVREGMAMVEDLMSVGGPSPDSMAAYEVDRGANEAMEEFIFFQDWLRIFAADIRRRGLAENVIVGF